MFFYGLDSYGPGESKPTVANQPNTGSWGTPGHAPAPPPSCLRDLEAFQWSGGRSDPHVSKLTFGLESEYFYLNRPSSHSKAEFLAWAAQTGQIRAILEGYSSKTERSIPLFFCGLDSYGPQESKPTVANQPNTGVGPHGHVPLACRQDFGGLPVVGRAFRPRCL